MRKLPLWLAFFSIAPLAAETVCEMPKALFLSSKHVEGKGVGYHHGYTSLEAFFAPAYWVQGRFLPLLDFRVHIFNNGLPAANAGIGLRYLSKRTWGVNAFYDFRETKRKNYNQISVGLESLGKVWDFRVNGYLPILQKTTSLYNTHFSHFSGHSMMLSNNQQFAFKSLQAEIGTHAIKVRHRPAYLAMGPYYLAGYGKATWGGRGRFGFDFFNYMRAEASVSYDSLFQWIGQGQIRLTVPFGPKKARSLKWSSSCRTEKQIARQAVQRIDRNEIIPIDTRTVYTKAINPTTNEPYVFWFVDNESHGHGTYESAYPTLLQAEHASSANDVIYAFPGNGTDKGMRDGIILKEGQRLFGSGVKQSVPVLQQGSIFSISIPKESSTYPLISLSETPVITRGIVVLADNCEVSGVHISSIDDFLGTKVGAIVGGPTANAISQDPGVKNPLIHNNVIEGTYYVAGIFLHNSNHSVTIENNQLSNIRAFSGISVLQDISPSTKKTKITGNTLDTMSGDGIYVQNGPDMLIENQTIIASHNTVINTSVNGISVANLGDPISSRIQEQSIKMISNTISNVADNGIFILNTDNIHIVDQTVAIAHNKISDCLTGRGVFFDNNGTSMVIDLQSTTIKKNTISDIALEGVLFLNYNEVAINTQNTTIDKNTMSTCAVGGLAFSNSLTITSQNQVATITNNTISSAAQSGITIQNDGLTIETPPCIFIQNNTLDGSAIDGFFITSFSDTRMNVNLSGNTVSNTAVNRSLVVNSNDVSEICMNITNNIFDKDIIFAPLDASNIDVAPLENNQYEDIIGGYNPVPAGTCDCQ